MMNRWRMRYPMIPEYRGDLKQAHTIAKEKTTICSIYRKHIRTMLFHSFVFCQFPGCVSDPAEMHELVNRGRTNPDTWQRLLTYQPELCSLLCHEHHEQAHNPNVRDILFRQNYKRYTPEKVVEAFALLKLAVPDLDIILPSETE